MRAAAARKSTPAPEPVPGPLMDRVTALLCDTSAGSDAFPPLLRDVADALAGNRQDRDAATAAALDLKVSAEISRAARVRLEDLEHEAKRLALAEDRLDAARTAALKGEDEARAARAYEAAMAERDAVAGELRARYPELVRELVTLLDRSKASDAAIASVNGKAPGREWLARAETIARDVNGSMRLHGSPHGTIVPHLIHDVQLPHLDGHAALNGYAWHPRHAGPVKPAWE